MKKNFLLLLIAVFSVLGTRATTIVPSVSTEGNDVWYMIKCNPRNPDNLNETWISVTPDNKLMYAEYTGADEQFWKVVANGDGVAIVNKKTGQYIDSDSRRITTSVRITTVAAMPTTTLQLVPSTNYPNHKWPGWDGTIPGVFILDKNGSTVVDANNVISVGDNTNAFALSIYAPASGDLFVANQPGWIGNVNQVVLFRTAEEVVAEFKLDLMGMIAKATAAFENSSEGINPGQFNAGDRDALWGVIELAQEAYDDPTATIADFKAAKEELRQIYEIFKSTVILPEISTSTKTVWYYIQGTRPVNTYLTAPTVGSGTPVKGLAVIPDDTQLWKLVSSGEGFALQNKATSEYIQTDFPSGTNLTTQADLPVKALQFITSDEIFNKTFRFWIENSPGFTEALRLHAGNGGLMNWTGDKADNSSWLFVSHLDALKLNFETVLNEARAELGVAVKGSVIGQYNEEVYNAYKSVIETAEAFVVEDMTEEEFVAAVEMLKAAKDAFVCNTDIATLQSPTPATTDYWFRLVSASTATYAKAKAISSNGREVDQKFTFENVVEESDAQLFRFELNEYGASVKAIVNKANDKYLGANGAILAEPTPGVEFAVEALDGFSFKIVPTGYAPIHAAQAGTEILNWDAGAGSASAWKFVFVKEASNIVLLPAARTITVTSSDPSKGTAVITGTSDVIVTTDVKKVSVTATANKGIFFTGWTNAAGDTVSKANPYIYSGESNIELTANFVDGYYKAMTRFYSAANPTVQQEERYLESAYAIVGDATQVLFEGVAVNPNPIAESVTPGQVIGDALLDYTSTKIEIPAGATSFNFKAVGRNTDATVEDLQWTQQIAFIDWNQDFDFVDAGEVSEKNSTDYDTTLVDPAGYTRTIQIPAQLPEGYYRMRVVYHEPVAGGDNWGLSIWSTGKIRNGVAYDFEIKYGSPSAVESTYVPQLKVRVVNSVIVVDGVESFELYNITGQKLQTNRPVRTGVYLVKSGDKVQKVFVR